MTLERVYDTDGEVGGGCGGGGGGITSVTLEAASRALILM